MKTVTTHKFTQPIVIIGVGAAVAAALAGGVFLLNTPLPASQPLPEMAERPVTLPDGEELYVQRHEVTVAEWNLCHADGGCTLKLRTRNGFTPDTTPATGLSFVDVSEYLRWFNEAARHEFRLPTTAEWEHIARAVLPEEPDPIFTDPSLTWASSYLYEGLTPRALKPQGSFSTSPEGVVDLDGSVWEWTQECYSGTEADPDRCPAFFVGGEHLAAVPFLVRDPARGGCAVGSPPAHLGMRLVSDTPVGS
ncbi:SUMF1/EgtB/PvdO family nonheme iron enzyme [Roseibium sp. RKSG952]|uniref:formylglycine-generating enzyme family protein n=1 Tax=Roseibium sp. RKSG952 TaxID=2529384 RepID=UPI0012BD2CE6|nr:SUMF1/EgtB/PvdO family nonheme iron enzyme [Roseibium sp. RKSG952]MTI02073.1 formylglycine-generating enzyme family protein [Roseibium sp. RKSG952]